MNLEVPRTSIPLGSRTDSRYEFRKPGHLGLKLLLLNRSQKVGGDLKGTDETIPSHKSSHMSGVRESFMGDVGKDVLPQADLRGNMSEATGRGGSPGHCGHAALSLTKGGGRGEFFLLTPTKDSKQ